MARMDPITNMSVLRLEKSHIDLIRDDIRNISVGIIIAFRVVISASFLRFLSPRESNLRHSVLRIR